MQPIIKSKKKYKLLKIANGIKLDEYKTEMRLGAKGVSCEKFGELWFLTPKGRALFKDYNLKTEGMRIVNELLYDKLADQIGLPVAKYLPAEYNSYPARYNLLINKEIVKKPDPDHIYHGIASIDVTKEDERIYNGEDLLLYDDFYGFETFVDYMKALNIFKTGEGYRVDKEGIKTTLFKMMVLDALTFMEDRNSFNVTFIRNRKEKYLIASPVLDNEMCFAGKNLWFNDDDSLVDVDLKRFLTMHGKEMRLCVNKTSMNSSKETRYVTNVRELVKLSMRDKEMFNFLTQTVENLDIDKAIKNVENMGYEVSAEYADYCKNLMKISKGIFKKYIKNYKKDDELVKER